MSSQGSPIARVFIGSSSEGRDIAERLAARLEMSGEIETKLWSQSVFGVGDYALDSLIAQASASDFAILVLSPDDSVESRATQSQAPRDNVVFELGLFVGALGRNRTYMVQPHGVDLKLPTDLAGITQARYHQTRSDGDLDSALLPATLQIRDRMKKVGTRQATESQNVSVVAQSTATSDIERSLHLLEANLVPQGWQVRWNQPRTTLRVLSPRGKRTTLKMTDASRMPQEFDRFIRELRGFGARVDSSLRR